MRILLIAGFAESIVAFRGDLISNLQEAGCEVHVAAPGIKALTKIGESLRLAPDQIHELSIKRNSTNPMSDLWLMFAMFQLMRKIRPDATLPYTIKPVIYGTMAAWLARVPRRFALITGLGYAFTGERRSVIKRIASSLYRLALARASKVFFQNPDDERLFRELGVLPVAVESRVINGSGINLTSHELMPIPEPPMVFLMIGRLLGDKGVRQYAEAARIIKQNHPETVFRLAGWIDSNPDAIAREELDEWIASDTIEFLGKLDDVRPAFAAASVYVLPSYREGTPRTVLEAMAIGRPIITTDAPGCRQTVVEGENGFLVPVKSIEALAGAMRKFIEAPSLAVRMGRRSRQITEDKYDVRKVNAIMLREMGITTMKDSGSENG